MKLLVLINVIGYIFGMVPMPTSFSAGPIPVRLMQSCKIGYSNLQQHELHIIEVIEVFHALLQNECKLHNIKQQGQLYLHIELEHQDKIHAPESERYQLSIDTNLNVFIKAENHWGLVRALTTLHDVVSDQIIHLPLQIEDEPAFAHRGVMIDTSRHYLSIKTIEKTIVALMLNKMNILHWHIVDDESFPWLLNKNSIIANTSRYYEGAIYTYSDIKHIINYAMVRGVAVIPELDTPGHTWSWGRSSQYKDLVLTCGIAHGQLDPTLEGTYTLITQVMQELSDLFSEAPFVHFGGDEVDRSCYDQRPQIKEFMNAHGLADYDALQTYFRQRQKQIWRQVIKNTKQVAYWYNKDVNLPSEDDDIIHWWGTTAELSEIATKKNKIILSDYNVLYLDTGMGQTYGEKYSKYHTWKDIYKWSPFPSEIQGTVIGAEACLWGETNNDATHFVKLFIRASVLADRLWNPYAKDTEEYKVFVARLIKMEDLLTDQGIIGSPVTSDYCKRNVDVCFPKLTAPNQEHYDIQTERLIDEELKRTRSH